MLEVKKCDAMMPSDKKTGFSAKPPFAIDSKDRKRMKHHQNADPKCSLHPKAMRKRTETKSLLVQQEKKKKKEERKKSIKHTPTQQRHTTWHCDLPKPNPSTYPSPQS